MPQLPWKTKRRKATNVCLVRRLKHAIMKLGLKAVVSEKS